MQADLFLAIFTVSNKSTESMFVVQKSISISPKPTHTYTIQTINMHVQLPMYVFRMNGSRRHHKIKKSEQLNVCMEFFFLVVRSCIQSHLLHKYTSVHRIRNLSVCTARFRCPMPMPMSSSSSPYSIPNKLICLLAYLLARRTLHQTDWQNHLSGTYKNKTQLINW